MKAIFLDAAGTLFDLAEPVGEVYARFAAQHGLQLDAQTAESRFPAAFQNLPSPDYCEHPDGHQCEVRWWRQLVLQVAQTPDNAVFENFFRELFAYYEKPQAWQIFPDTLPFLAEMRDRYRLAVVSNFDARLHPILENLALTPYFEAVISSADARSRKPDSQIFRHALNQLQVAPEDVLHIGDSKKADYEGAFQAGLHAFHLQRAIGQTLPDALRERPLA